MSDAKFTPGPWNLEPSAGWEKVIVITQDGDGWHRLYVEVDCDDCDTDTAGANARLISAAPDLLEAAVEALDVFYERKTFPKPEERAKVADKLRAAIAKAVSNA